MESASSLVGTPNKSIYSGSAVESEVDKKLAWFVELQRDRNDYHEIILKA
jgi:hypothetical protein